jgi:Transcriptional regulators
MNQKLLLTLLEKNARLSVTDLATALQESKSNILETMNELQKQKIICGYHTIINWDKTSTEQVMAFIELNIAPEKEYGYDRIAKKIYQYEEVDTMYLLSGSKDFIVFINGKSMQEIAQFVGTKLACINEVTGTATSFVLKPYKVAGIIFEDGQDNSERLIIT